MHAFLALVIAFAAPAQALASPRDRAGYEREIESTNYNQVPKLQDYVLNRDYIALQKNKPQLITKPERDDSVVDNVILESNVVKIVKKTLTEKDGDLSLLVRKRRGYNLENVRVPARYPYLPVPNYNRFRRWG